MIIDKDLVVLEEYGVLEKFEGEPKPENLSERVHILNGQIVKREFIENGKVVDTIEYGGDE